MTADAIGPLLAMQQATTIHDAHRCAVDAAKAGATDAEVGQAITEWMALQAAQVQTVGDEVASIEVCEHDWMEFGKSGDSWLECFLCGRQEDAE